MDEEFRQAEERVQAAMRAVDAATDELRGARKALNELDRRRTRQQVEAELGPSISTNKRTPV